MNRTIHAKLFVVLFAAAIALSSCHTRRRIIVGETDKAAKSVPADVLKGEPGEIVKPEKSIADKYAEMMEVDKSSIQNGRLYEFIDQWAGVPYKFGGNDKEGVDCSGFALLLEQEVYGITIPRVTSQQVTVIKRKYEEELKEGDLVFFNIDGGQFNHVGVYLQNGYFVHASSSKGVIVVKLHVSMYKDFSRAGSIITPVIAAEK